MKQLLFAAGLLLAGCQSKPDFTKVKAQMSAAETIALVGEPTKKTPFIFDTELWLYKDQNVLLTMQHDTVQDVNHDAATTLREVGEKLEGAEEELKKVEGLDSRWVN